MTSNKPYDLLVKMIEEDPDCERYDLVKLLKEVLIRFPWHNDRYSYVVVDQNRPQAAQMLLLRILNPLSENESLCEYIKSEIIACTSALSVGESIGTKS